MSSTDMIHPAQCIITSSLSVYYAISSSIFCATNRGGRSRISQVYFPSPISSREKRKNVESRAITNMAITNMHQVEYLITFGEDKVLRVFMFQEPESHVLVSERELAKRGSSLQILTTTQGEQLILVGDKFGDVYSFPLLEQKQEAANPTSPVGVCASSLPTTAGIELVDPTVAVKPSKALQRPLLRDGSARDAGQALENDDNDEESDQLPILGHVSMLTALAPLKDPAGNSFIATADRDEHVRISCFPKSYVIHSFLLGHAQFISSLLVYDDDLNTQSSMLWSAGGDDFVCIWDWKSSKLLRRISISHCMNNSEEKGIGFAVLGMWKLAPNKVLFLIEGAQKLYVMDVDGEDTEPVFTDIPLQGVPISLSIQASGSELLLIWVSHDTIATQQQENFECIAYDITAASFTVVESGNATVQQELLNKMNSVEGGRKIIENGKIEYTVHKAELLRKRTKAELEADRLTKLEEMKKRGEEKKRKGPRVTAKGTKPAIQNRNSNDIQISEEDEFGGDRYNSQIRFVHPN